MQVLQIQGGQRLVGSVDVSGSKNSALSLLSAVVLANGVTVLQNIPDIADVRTKAKILETFGATITWREGSLIVESSHLRPAEVDLDLASQIRTSFFLLGPLVARLGEAVMPAPGGCRIGARPVDYHIRGLEQLGAEIDFSNGIYSVRANRLEGTTIYLDYASPGATQHLMAAAALANGNTTIHNAAMEPEVVTLADFINSMGGKIEGAGTATITVTGVRELHGTTFRVPSDRIQAATYLVAGAITGGDVTAQNILPETQTPVVNKLREARIDVEEGVDWIRVRADRAPDGISIKTMPYPGFPTDMQQPMCALLSLANGVSIIEETVYEGRIGHIQELNRMGADITLSDRTSVIKGVPQLTGATVSASDLRAGAALVVAGLAAKGETTIRNVNYIDRGYEKLEETLTSLGAIIERHEIDEGYHFFRTDTPI
ncbi:MAG: UDP-N-acetylglucosamine 1-carboxyvinyltransferase [Fimbriimonadaceae bacterium]|nr:UDP-N-acetylglucosamine 1-carboxyvinyltransferase [Fimbriimonadaceae bacterium]